MKKFLSTLLSTSVVLSALTFGVSAAEVALTATGPSDPVALGDSITVELGLSSAVDVGAFDIAWDVPEGFISEEVVLSEAYSDAGFSGSANTEKGLANYFGTGYAETDQLVTITITAPTDATAWGDYELTFELEALNDKELGSHTVTTSVVAVPITIANDCEHEFDEGTVTTEGDCTTDTVTHFVCDLCGYEEDVTTTAPGHTEDAGVVTTEPTCKDGVKTYTCTVCGEVTKTEPVAATGEHTFGEWEVTTPAECEAEGVETRICTICDTPETKAIPATGHTMVNNGAATYEHPCQPGIQPRKCEDCDHTDTVSVEPTAEHSYGEDDKCVECGEDKCIHEWSDWTVTTAPKCEEEGAQTRTCPLCGKVETEVIPATGHTENAGKITTPATCVKEGVKTYSCSVCKNELRTEVVPVDPKAHAWAAEGTVTTPATCTTDGVMSYACTNVNGEITCDGIKNEKIAAYGHHDYTSEITVEPTCTTAGERTYTCAEGDDSYTERISATGHSFKNSICVVCGYKRPEIIVVKPSEDDEPDTTEPEIVFEDVDEDADYYDAVYWAVDTGITNGMTATTFGPDFTCTRAQIVTFLWRAAGEPEPVDPYCAFTDVEDGAYYETALLWAIENGITKGTSATTFSPDVLITKEQFLTFLYRFNGCPDVETDIDFEDVNVAEYYVPAIAWALDNEIATADSETVFGIGTPCSRAQSVTYLYLCFGN